MILPLEIADRPAEKNFSPKEAPVRAQWRIV